MIINTERSRLGRLVDIFLTGLGWACFLYLVCHGVWSISAGLGSHTWEDLQPFLRTLSNYALVAVFNGLLLVSWAKYNRLRFARADRRRHLPRLHSTRLMRSFGVSAQQLAGLQDAKVAVVRHAADGRILK